MLLFHVISFQTILEQNISMIMYMDVVNSFRYRWIYGELAVGHEGSSLNRTRAHRTQRRVSRV